MDKYVVKDNVIVRTDTGKELHTMKDVAEHLNYLDGRNSYLARMDKDGVEYVDFVGSYADYYDLDELCELCNALFMLKTTKILSYCDKQFEKHMRIKRSKERKHKAPFIKDGSHEERFVFRHTTRKGFWYEDWLTGKAYYTHIKEHRNAIVGLLNDYTEDDRFITYTDVGEVIEDTVVGEKYFLMSSSDCCDIRDWLNWYDYSQYGRRRVGELPHKQILM